MMSTVLMNLKECQFNTTYNGTTSLDDAIVYRYRTDRLPETVAVRISTFSSNSTTVYPVLFVVRERLNVLSWQIPLVLRDVYEYSYASRILCPVDLNRNLDQAFPEAFTVTVSSQSTVSVPFSLKADILEGFTIQDSRNVVASASTPVYLLYTFPEGLDSVHIQANSVDKTCAVLSIQDIKCPVFDLDSDVDYQGKYQTMTTFGAITVTKKMFPPGRFFIVLVVKPNNLDCDPNEINEMNQESLQKQKHVTISVKTAITASQFYKAIGLTVGVFFGFCIGTILTYIIQWCCRKCGEENAVTERTPIVNADENDGCQAMETLDADKNFDRTRTPIYLSSLSLKREKKSDKNFKLYFKNLLAIAIFYGLPVLQLVIAYQKVLNITGNNDICYYNFACAYPWVGMSAFNNVFSNIGYMILGFLFLVIVYIREYIHRKQSTTDMTTGTKCCLPCIGMGSSSRNNSTKLYGIPQHYGLFYAMGLAMIMEGIMSACYHVCPTLSNFQYDTSFMYVMACLCILKIYQNRHPDITTKVHTYYLAMAVIIIVAVIGQLYSTLAFWVVFMCAYMTFSLRLSIEFYYKGRWEVRKLVIDCFHGRCCKTNLDGVRIDHKDRLCLLLIGNLFSFGISLYGVIKQPQSAAMVLLVALIFHLTLYCAFYIFMKLLQKKQTNGDTVRCVRCGEKIPWYTCLFILLAVIFWGLAIWMFVANLTSWQESPSGSREHNAECWFLGFYDKHDIWHFFSAISLFFSFMILLTFDDHDTVSKKSRDNIPVF
ncbi:SID1 transmembrane family member 1-like isoform X2 [Dreissena polymorpha]|nr:SID1 transmembrane family member 1-like isoform X2 [Dreissena polymorpha]XP_052228431.1 SID1 transmembrane family member 1-like isoform X2 [Dreissena polymorpha]